MDWIGLLDRICTRLDGENLLTIDQGVRMMILVSVGGRVGGLGGCGGSHAH